MSLKNPNNFKNLKPSTIRLYEAISLLKILSSKKLFEKNQDTNFLA